MLSEKERDLMQAVHVGDVKKASKLITEDRINVNIQDCLTRSPLLRTCYLESRQTRGTLAKLLLKNGADVNMSDRHGRTALMTACMEYDANELVKIFLGVRNINPNARDENGSTAMMHAVLTDNVDSVRTLVTWESKSEKLLVDLADLKGKYPLLVAAEQQNPDICEILVRDGGAKYSEIPNHLRQYLPPECRSGRGKSSDPFEKYRHQAQDFLNTPFRSPMILKVDPTPIENLESLEEDENNTKTDKIAKPTPVENSNVREKKTKMDDPRETPKETEAADVKTDTNPWMTGVAAAKYKKKRDENREHVNDETPVEKEKPKEAAPGDVKPRPRKANAWVAAVAVAKMKKKGSWIQETPKTPEPTKENPFPTIKPKKKGQAYKTKNGRVIHPNTKRNQQILNQIAKAPAKKQPAKAKTNTKPPLGATT